MAPISFRNSKITYYGPHDCPNCGQAIVKMSTEWGGNAFTNPSSPIYPNTEWHPHVCDPYFVKQKAALIASNRISRDYPQAHARKIGQLGFVIMGEEVPVGIDGGSYLVISANQTFCDTVEAAWASASERLENGWPSWHIDFSNYGPHSRFGSYLECFPQCSV
jgi:hypothetical protein